MFTFTRAARDELLGRILKTPEFLAIRERLAVWTLNSYGYQILKKNVNRPNLMTSKGDFYFYVNGSLRPVVNRHPSMALFAEQHRYNYHKVIIELIDQLKSLGFRHDQSWSADQINNHFSWLVNSGLRQHVLKLVEDLNEYGIVAFKETSEQFIKDFIEIVYPFWEDACRHAYDSATFTLTDQKYWALIDSDPSSGTILAQTKGDVSHILVDEFQDINVLDLNLVQALSRRFSAPITIVGDDDQAIYEWRGASPRFLVQPDQFFETELQTHILETNYRSPSNIVELSQRLIRNNKLRVDKQSMASSAEKASIEVYMSPNLLRTIRFVLDDVKTQLLASDNHRIAIIGRKRSQIIPYQILFARDGIEFCAAEDLNIFLSTAFEGLKELLAIRGSLSHETRDPYFIIDKIMVLCDKVKKFQLKKSDNQALRSYLRTQGPDNVNSVLDALRAYKGPLKGSSGTAMSGSFAEAIGPFLHAESVTDAIDALSRHFLGLQKDYAKSLDDVFYTDPPFMHLSEFAETYGNDFHGFLSDLQVAVATLSSSDTESKDDPDEVWDRQLHLMTALRAKGKEFDTVFVLDANDGIWPSKLAKSAEELEQERRLFYVSVTRVRKRLVIICNKSIIGQEVEVSPYIGEMGLSPVNIPE